MPEIAASHNQFAYSVSEISFALKRVVEDNFGQVRVRGEVTGLKMAASGHAYLSLKDDQAVLSAVCWKGTMGKLAFKPEDGLEVVCTGRLTTYPGRSNYQLVIDTLEPAGEGALMAQLAKLKQKLLAEGLFDEKNKRPLPFMPQVIGVITSPTGAVIRDILHRLADRFPTHVLVWPVLVQGEGAEQQIVAAINGFNAMEAGGTVPKPDLLIVARGGGSLEDLWAFNLESVVRAAAASGIPLISAVGHETDTTLIDFASDKRAPTPTAAAELAVPVREDWLFTLTKHYERMLKTIMNELRSRHDVLTGLTRGLLHPKRLLEQAAQKLDDWSERHVASLPALLIQRSQQLAVAGAKLEPRSLLQNLVRHDADILAHTDRLSRMVMRGVQDREAKLNHYVAMLESLSPNRVLERGFVMVRDESGHVVTRAGAMKQTAHTLVFHDGERVVKAV